MLRVDLGKDKFIELNIPDNLTGVVHQYHERFLADDSLSDIDVVLFSLHLLETNKNTSGASYEEVRRLFTTLGRKDQPNFAVAFHRARKQSFIDLFDNTVRFQVKGIKRLEGVLGFTWRAPIYLIKAGQSFSAIKLFEEFLMNEITGGEVLLCDSHISPPTLFPFSILKGKLQVLRILTSNVYENDKLIEYKNKLQKEAKLSVEIRQSYKIHDRYLISGKKCWGIGTSLKDLGNKDTVINELTNVVDSLKALFTERWAEATSI